MHQRATTRGVYTRASIAYMGRWENHTRRLFRFPRRCPSHPRRMLFERKQEVINFGERVPRENSETSGRSTRHHGGGRSNVQNYRVSHDGEHSPRRDGVETATIESRRDSSGPSERHSPSWTRSLTRDVANGAKHEQGRLRKALRKHICKNSPALVSAA